MDRLVVFWINIMQESSLSVNKKIFGIISEQIVSKG